MKSSVLPLAAASLFAALSFTACQPSAPQDPFARTQLLQADSIRIEQILSPRTWTVAGDRAIVASLSQDSVLYAYRLPDFEYLYSGLRAGGGPDELSNIYGSFLRSYPDGTFVLEDYGRRNMILHAADKDFALLRTASTRQKDARDGGPVPGDSVYAAVDYPPCEQGSAPGRLLLQDFYGRTLDSAACRSFVTTLTHEGERFSMGMNWPNFAYAGQTLALVYYETGRVEFYDLSRGKLSLEKATGDSTPVEELMEADLTRRSFQGVKYDAIVSDGKYFYVLANAYRYTGPQPDPSNIRFTSCILVYSRQGTPLRKYALDHPASDILAYRDVIYAYNRWKDFEQVYVYRPDEK